MISKVPSIPCVVSRDLSRHLAELDARQAKEARIRELTDERYKFLTEDRQGLSLVIENLYVDHKKLPLDAALFDLYTCWGEKRNTHECADKVASLLDHEASVMAWDWAVEQYEKEEDEAALAAAEAKEESRLDW